MRRSGVVAVLVVFALGPLAGRSDAQSGPMRVHFLDMGQGDATLIEFPCAAMLIDTGGEKFGPFDSRNELTKELDAFFARRTDLGRRLELVVLTHPHIDHTLGVGELLGHGIQVRHLVTNGERGRGKGLREQTRLANSVPATYRRDVRFSTVEAVGAQSDAILDPIDCTGSAGGVDPVIRVLWGHIGADPGWGYTTYKGERSYRIDDPNNHSVVVRIDYGKASLLFTGDLEEKAIEDLVAAYAGTDLLNVDVYQVGHHGSDNGTTPALLTAMSPKMAVISMGPASRTCSVGGWLEGCYTAYRHGHPRQRVVQLLDREVSLRRQAPVTVEVATGQRSFVAQPVAGCVYATGWSGTVVLEARAADGWLELVEPSAEPCGGHP